MRIHVTLKDDQVICWFDLDRDDEGFEEKRDCAISFYDEVVRFLVDRFGEEFKYEDPRISADYIDRNNMYGQYDIVLDDDGENAPVIAIWEDEENEMKPRINENKFGKLVKENDDMEKEFVCKGVSITRYDYESLPDPMAASQLDDETMQKIACDIYDYLSSANWSDEEISKYLGSHLDDVLDDDWKGDEIKDEFWRYMEKAAIENGMKYYEDMPEGEYVDESSRKIVKEGAGYTEENLIGRKITTAYGADRDPHNARPATIVDAHRRRTSTGMVFDLTVELDDTGETIEQTFNPLSVGDKYTWGPWFRDGEERQYNPYEREYSESRKLVKEGAGAGYTVEIKNLRFGKILSKNLVPDKYYGYYECQVEILPGEYEIAAEDYYNDFFWQEHEFGETPKAKIDGGVATVVYSKQWEDDEQAEDDLVDNVENVELDISFSYGRGWSHANLPREKIEADHINVDNDGYYAGIDKIELNAPDLADAVNSGYESTFDRGEDEEDEVPVDESTGAAKINLTWDEFNKLCDLIDMDWNRWNKNNAKSIPMVADRAVEHLEWITNKRLKGLDPKDVTISYTIPGSGIDEYDTGTQNTQTIYELIEGMAWDNYNPYNESDYAPLGRGKPRKTKDVIIKVDVEWAGMDSEDDDDEQYLDDVGLPGSVYIKIPFESYADGELDYDLRTKLGNTFDGYVEDYTYHRVEPRAVPKGVPIYLWRPETDIMEEF